MDIGRSSWKGTLRVNLGTMMLLPRREYPTSTDAGHLLVLVALSIIRKTNRQCLTDFQNVSHSHQRLLMALREILSVPLLGHLPTTTAASAAAICHVLRMGPARPLQLLYATSRATVQSILAIRSSRVRHLIVIWIGTLATRRCPSQVTLVSSGH